MQKNMICTSNQEVHIQKKRKKELEEGHIKFLEYAEKAQKKLARYEKLKK